jgi:hypothetical protein
LDAAAVALSTNMSTDECIQDVYLSESGDDEYDEETEERIRKLCEDVPHISPSEYLRRIGEPLYVKRVDHYIYDPVLKENVLSAYWINPEPRPQPPTGRRLFFKQLPLFRARYRSSTPDVTETSTVRRRTPAPQSRTLNEDDEPLPCSYDDDGGHLPNCEYYDYSDLVVPEPAYTLPGAVRNYYLGLISKHVARRPWIGVPGFDDHQGEVQIYIIRDIAQQCDVVDDTFLHLDTKLAENRYAMVTLQRLPVEGTSNNFATIAGCSLCQKKYDSIRFSLSMNAWRKEDIDSYQPCIHAMAISRVIFNAYPPSAEVRYVDWWAERMTSSVKLDPDALTKEVINLSFEVDFIEASGFKELKQTLFLLYDSDNHHFSQAVVNSRGFLKCLNVGCKRQSVCRHTSNFVSRFAGNEQEQQKTAKKEEVRKSSFKPMPENPLAVEAVSQRRFYGK